MLQKQGISPTMGCSNSICIESKGHNENAFSWVENGRTDILVISYFFSPSSISVCPTQIPCVSTLTTPFLYEKRSGRTNATKLTGSWRKIPVQNEYWSTSSSMLSRVKQGHKKKVECRWTSQWMRYHKANLRVKYKYHGRHQILRASPCKIYIYCIKTLSAFLSIALARLGPHLERDNFRE